MQYISSVYNTLWVSYYNMLTDFHQVSISSSVCPVIHLLYFCFLIIFCKMLSTDFKIGKSVCGVPPLIGLTFSGVLWNKLCFPPSDFMSENCRHFQSLSILPQENATEVR